MATAYHNLSDYDFNSVPNAENMRFGIVVSEWNSNITGPLLEGAVNTLKKHGAKDENILVQTVPGSFELTYGSAQMIKSGKVDVIRTICIRFFLHFRSDFHVLSFFLLSPVYCQILCYNQAVGFNRFKLRPLITLVPHSYHGILNDILGFGPIQGDSESQSKEFILQRQNIVSEADFLHLYNNDGLGYEKLQSPTTFF